jgi:ATP-dependent DNA helicase RecQ
VLDVDGAVQRVSGGWESTGTPWEYDAERYARVDDARQREQQLMLEYEATSRCRMAFLQTALDDDTARACGRCDRCTRPWYSESVPDAARERASARLARAGVELEPRAQWPSGMGRLGVEESGKIAPEERPATGRALARLTDLGWGQRLRELLASPDAPLPEPVLRACAGVLRDWGWDERPVAVTWVPSRRRPELVRSLATGLAGLGRLTDLGPLELVDGGPTGEPGGNSAFRLAGVWGRLAVGDELRAALAGTRGPVLLVDDVADSRWTLTVASQQLRRHGAAAVLPFTLALAG